MAITLVKNIKKVAGLGTPAAPLRGNNLSVLNSIDNAYLLIEDNLIVAYGPMTELKHTGFDEEVDASGRFVLPAWCDSHTHLVFATSREEEFVDKLKGLTYAEIAARGGGILNSARKLQAATEDELFNSAWKRLEELAKWGTGAVEIKSGYGLTAEAELKMLRVIKKLKEKVFTSFASVIVQIVMVDAVFSFDSILTAIGMVDEVFVMILAVVISIAIMMLFAGPISRFINKNPTLQMLALSFLIAIGIMLVAEGFHQKISKSYIYTMIAFSLLVELLNMRLRKRNESIELPKSKLRE